MAVAAASSSASAAQAGPPDLSTLPGQSDFDTLRILTTTFLVLTWLTFALRLYSRGFLLKALKLDDLFLALAQATWSAFVSAGFKLIQLQGSPALLAMPANLALLKNLIMLSTLGYYFTMLLLKTSISITFVRLFWHEKPKVILIYSVLALTVVCGLTCAVIAGIFLSTFNPASAGSSVNHRFDLVNTIFGLVNTIGDVITAGFAIMAIAQTTMNRMQRISASALVLVGSSGCAISIIRVTVLLRYSASSNPKAGFRTATWSMVEAAVCLVAISLMACRPLLSCLKDKAVNSTIKATSPKTSALHSHASTNPHGTPRSLITSPKSLSSSRRSMHLLEEGKVNYVVEMGNITKEVRVDVRKDSRG